MFNQNKSVIEVLEVQDHPLNHDSGKRVAYFKTWREPPWQGAWTWENKDEQREWRSGSSKRAASAPARRSKERTEITMEERKIDPVEKP